MRDDLEWLAERHTLAISKQPGGWDLSIGWCEMPDVSFSKAPDLARLLAQAREWAESPFAKQFSGDEWQRLCETAVRQGRPVADLVRQGARELLDKLGAGQADG